VWASLALAALLAQAQALRLAPPWIMAQPELPGTKIGAEPPPGAPGTGLELGTRLLPFGEAEPSRGPLAPEPPRESQAIGAAEWRQILLARARLAHRGSDLSPGPKDPWHAVALSAEGLLAGLLFPPLLTVGPSAGQAYAGEWTQGAITSSLRTVFVVAIAVAAVWFGGQATSGRLSAGQISGDAAVLDVVTLVSGTGIALTSGFDIATAYSEAAHANARWERSVLGQAP